MLRPSAARRARVGLREDIAKYRPAARSNAKVVVLHRGRPCHVRPLRRPDAGRRPRVARRHVALCGRRARQPGEPRHRKPLERDDVERPHRTRRRSGNSNQENTGCILGQRIRRQVAAETLAPSAAAQLRRNTSAQCSSSSGISAMRREGQRSRQAACHLAPIGTRAPCLETPRAPALPPREVLRPGDISL